MPIAVSQYNGSHFTMLKMMEGFIKRDEIKIANHGTHRQRHGGGDVRQGQGREPAGAVDQRRRGQGRRVIIESHSTRSEAAGDEMDGPTLAKMFRAEARAAEAIQKNPEKYAHYIVEEAGGLIGAEGPQAGAHPQRAARRPTRASASTTTTTGRSAGAWCRPAPPTRTPWTTAPGSSETASKKQVPKSVIPAERYKHVSAL